MDVFDLRAIPTASQTIFCCKLYLKDFGFYYRHLYLIHFARYCYHSSSYARKIRNHYSKKESLVIFFGLSRLRDKPFLVEVERVQSSENRMSMSDRRNVSASDKRPHLEDDIQWVRQEGVLKDKIFGDNMY